jgi:hypothetical protein
VTSVSGVYGSEYVVDVLPQHCVPSCGGHVVARGEFGLPCCAKLLNAEQEARYLVTSAPGGGPSDCRSAKSVASNDMVVDNPASTTVLQKFAPVS